MGTAADEEIRDGLRAWAKGIYPTEAAIELLIRGFGVRGPWIEPSDSRGMFWIHNELLIEHGVYGPYSGGERRLLAIVASLLSAEKVDLGEALPGLDRRSIDLVLAAVAHAAGTHEHSGEVVFNEAQTAIVGFGPKPGPLYPWPDA